MHEIDFLQRVVYFSRNKKALPVVRPTKRGLKGVKIHVPRAQGFGLVREIGRPLQVRDVLRLPPQGEGARVAESLRVFVNVFFRLCLLFWVCCMLHIISCYV